MTTSPRRLSRWLMPAGIAAGALSLGLFALGAFAIPATVRIPKVKPHPAGTPQEAALFSHVEHDGLRCFRCHPSPFPQALKGFTHQDMSGGAYCGTCHDGRRASAVTSYTCDRCHVPHK